MCSSSTISTLRTMQCTMHKSICDFAREINSHIARRSRRRQFPQYKVSISTPVAAAGCVCEPLLDCSPGSCGFGTAAASRRASCKIFETQAAAVVVVVGIASIREMSWLVLRGPVRKHCFVYQNTESSSSRDDNATSAAAVSCSPSSLRRRKETIKRYDTRNQRYRR